MSARDTILVVGAGASHGARPLAPDPPPLGFQLAEYLLAWFQANAPSDGDREWGFRLGNPLDRDAPSEELYERGPDVLPTLRAAAERTKTSPAGFEEIMGELLRGGERDLLMKVNNVICYSLLGGRGCAFLRERDLYDDLLAPLGTRLRGIITPNYDLLAEEALERVGLPYRHRGVDNGGPADAAVVIDKFHGSVNWLQPLGVAAGHSLESIRRRVKPLEAVPQRHMPSFYNGHPVHASVGDRRINAILGLKQHHGASPVLVTYGPGKDAMFSRPTLDRIRSECAAELRANPPARIIAVGIAPPRGDGDDDAWESLCKVLASLDSEKVYWSKDVAERGRMADYGFEGRPGFFADLVVSLATSCVGATSIDVQDDASR